METKKENKYNADDMTYEYREGYKEGYRDGFHDGKYAHRKEDCKRDVG